MAGGWLKRLSGALHPQPAAEGSAPVPLPDDERLPLYLQAEHGRLQLDGDLLRLSAEGEPTLEVPIAEVSEVILVGPVGVTTPCLHVLMQNDVPVSWHTARGWFLGHTVGLGGARLAARLAQYRASGDAAQALTLARVLVAAKIHACRVLLRRNHKGARPPHLQLCKLERLEFDAERADDLAGLRGIEGSAAALYFRHFPDLVAAQRRHGFLEAFPGRRRRPPTDPLNAALSFAYAMLTRAAAVAVSATGLDPQLGFYHQPRAGRPALALDLIEPLRPLVADSAVLTAVNTGRIRDEHFDHRDDAVLLAPEGRRRLIAAFEARLQDEIEHPAFARPLTYRQWLSAQARLLADHLSGARPDFPQLRPR